MRIAKSHLYIPADSERKILSAVALSSDSYILDLEDGVAPNRKAHALAQLAATLTQLQKPDVWVRINSGPEGLADRAELAKLKGVTGIWIPKAEPGPLFEKQISSASAAGLRVGALIESAPGYIGRHELLAPEVVTGVQIGEYDLRGDLGMAENTPESESDLQALRLEVVIAAVANRVESIVAGVSANFTDLAEYQRSSQRVKNLGFNGRAVIHPAQVEVCNRVFHPSEQEILSARETVARFEAQLKDGVGAYRDENGNMTDAATVRRAQRILEQLN
jgi:citrate lyase subunit beta/citryl-CoA lyase